MILGELLSLSRRSSLLSPLFLVFPLLPLFPPLPTFSVYSYSPLPGTSFIVVFLFM